MPKSEWKIRELIDKISRKELILPEMQRRYVWPGTRVRDLLDSLYRAYPSGTILAWETDEDIETREISIKTKGEPSTTTKLLLLDGQQRLTSLAAVVTGEPIRVRHKKRPIEILFNLDHPDGPPIDVDEVNENEGTMETGDTDDEEEEFDIQEQMKKRTFVVGSRALKNNPIWVSVSLGINSDDKLWDKYTERLGKVRDILKYQYTVQVLEKSMSYKEVTEIFVRVNSLGIKLRGSDLALAQITAKWRGFIKMLEAYVEKFEEDGDFIFESGLPIRTMIAIITGQSRFETVGKISLKKLQDGWDRADENLKFAYDFMENNAEIDAIGQLSSPFLLIPIAYYAHQNDQKISPADSKKILRWFFYANLRAHYSTGSSESILDADLNVLKKSNFDSLLDQLKNHVRKFDLDSQELIGKNVNSSFFYMYYLALKKNGVQDWRTSLKLSQKTIGKSYKIEYDHIFPRAILYANGFEPKEVNEIANLAFVSSKANKKKSKRPPSEYLAEVVKEHGPEMLKAHLIPIDPKLWELNNYHGFLEERRNLIAEAVNNHIKSFD